MTPDEELVLRHAGAELRADVFQPLNERLLRIKADLWSNRVTRALNSLVTRKILWRQPREGIGWDSYRVNAEHPAIKALRQHANPEGESDS